MSKSTTKRKPGWGDRIIERFQGLPEEHKPEVYAAMYQKLADMLAEDGKTIPAHVSPTYRG